jgi:hypothetical protein
VKILGLNPKDFYTGWPVQSDFGRELYRTPALTFPVLKRLLPPGHEMRFLDGFFAPIPMRKYLELVRWADVVGFNIASSYGALSYAVAIQQIKRLNPKALVLAGGHHAGMFARRWLELGVDLVVRGEAERTFTDLVNEIAGPRQFERIPGVGFLRDGEYVETPEPPLLESLDESPIPDFDLTDYTLFPCKVDRGGGYAGSLECSRGCTFRCNFCAVPLYWKGKQRYKSIGRVMEEVKRLTARRVRQINIVDDGFGNDVDYTEELAAAFRRFPEKLNWQSFLRVDTVLERPELIDRLAASGLKATLLGFESLNEEVLKKAIGKGLTVKPGLPEYRELYQRFRRNQVLVVGVFISGHPDIAEDQDASYLDARTICDDPRLADYMPFPGTIGHDRLILKHQIKDMFFHDVKLPIFPGQDTHAFRFNLLNILDLPRSLRLLRGPTQYRTFLLWTHWKLWTKFLRVNPRKLRDFRLLRRRDLSSDQKQARLFQAYLEDPDYQKWLDGLTAKVWF